MVFFEDVVPFNLEAVFNLIYDIFKINDLYNQTLKNTYAKQITPHFFSISVNDRPWK